MSAFLKKHPSPLPVEIVLYLLQYLSVNVLYIVVHARQNGHRKGAQEKWAQENRARMKNLAKRAQIIKKMYLYVNYFYLLFNQHLKNSMCMNLWGFFCSTIIYFVIN